MTRRKTVLLQLHVCDSYDISSLEVQLETVSKATKQPDTPAPTTEGFLEAS